jgi:hypothetical protein
LSGLLADLASLHMGVKEPAFVFESLLQVRGLRDSPDCVDQVLGAAGGIERAGSTSWLRLKNRSRWSRKRKHSWKLLENSSDCVTRDSR